LIGSSTFSELTNWLSNTLHLPLLLSLTVGSAHAEKHALQFEEQFFMFMVGTYT
jgi:hypothetical protein